MNPKEFLGRRVRITSWEHLDFFTDYLRRTRQLANIEGVVTQVEPFGNEDVWVQIEGLEREYAFGPDQFELLPQGAASRSEAGNPLSLGLFPEARARIAE